MRPGEGLPPAVHEEKPRAVQGATAHPLATATVNVTVHDAEDHVLVTLVERFLATCGTEATRKTYRGVLKEFGPYYGAIPGASGAKTQLGLAAEGYVVALRARLAARSEREATVKRKMSALSSFLEFCVQEAFLARNPLARLKRPAVTADTGAERALTRVERDALLAQARRERDEATGAKAVRQAIQRELIVRLCLTSGCRIGELLRIRADDITPVDEAKAKVVFLAKGQKEHAVYVPRALADDLLGFARTQNSGRNAALFYPSLQRKSAEEALLLTLKSLAKRAGLTKTVTIHTLRATCATLLHEAGVPLVKIQRLLGHQSIVTTSSYVRMEGGLLPSDLPF